MKLNRSSDNVILSSEDEQFVGTILEGQGFTIEIKKILRAEGIDSAQKASNTDGSFSNGAYSKANFCDGIVTISGITNEDETTATAEDIWEYAPNILVGAVRKVIDGFNAIDEKKSELVEQDSNDSQTGL